MSQHTISVTARNTHKSSVYRAETIFPPRETITATIPVQRLPEVKACRYLEIVSVDTDAPDEGDADSESPDDGDGSDNGSALDPAAVVDGKVDEVLAYVEAHPDDRDAVLEAELAGKNRPTLIEALRDADDDAGSDESASGSASDSD